MKSYNSYLKEIELVLGTQVTNSRQLEAMCIRFFPKHFQGVYARDKFLPQKGKYAIVNLDKTGQPGTHWVAVADGLLYDSFGRLNTLQQNLPTTEEDIEQGYLQENCGQRCIAWLCVFHVEGREVAQTI